MKQIMQIAAFLMVMGLSVASGIIGAVSWKDTISKRLDKIEENQHDERMQILWIMENMQRKPGSTDYLPQNYKEENPRINWNAVPDIADCVKHPQESTNSPAYTYVERDH